MRSRERSTTAPLVVALAAVSLLALLEPPGAGAQSCRFLVRTTGQFNNNAVIEGDLGANDRGGLIRIGQRAFLVDGTVLRSDRASLGNFSSIFDLATNTLTTGRGASVRGSAGTPLLPLANPFCPLPAFACAGSAVRVSRRGTRAPLPPGTYGDIMLRNDSTLTLAGGGTFEMCSLVTGKRVEVRVTGSGQTTINVTGSVRLANETTLLADPGTPPPVLNIAGRELRLGQGAALEGFVSAPNAGLSLGRDARIRGSFCVRQAISDKGIHLECLPRHSTTTTTTSTTSTTTTPASTSTTTTTSTTQPTSTTTATTTTSTTSTTTTPASTSTTTATSTTQPTSTTTAATTSTTTSTATTTSSTTTTTPPTSTTTTAAATTSTSTAVTMVTTTSTTTTTPTTTSTTAATTTSTSTSTSTSSTTRASTTTTTTTAAPTTSTTVPPPIVLRLDHFLCYRTNGKHGFTVTLSDQFDSGTFQAFHKKVTAFCTPAEKATEGIIDPVTHLKVYRVKGPHVPRFNVEVTNQFGTFFFDTRATESLMVPSSKSLSPGPFPPPPDPATHSVDHYRCVRVRTSNQGPKFPTGITRTVKDQFGTREVTLTRPTKLCVPADKNGEGIKQPERHLMCYKIHPIPMTRVDGVQASDQFGPETHRLRGEQEFCVPSTKRL